MKIIYFKDTGRVNRVIGSDQEIENYFIHYPKEYKDNLDYIELEDCPKKVEDYVVINDELVELNNLEISEIREYGKILSEEERLENKLLGSLLPSVEEIRKAEQTIELLELLQEVL